MKHFHFGDKRIDSSQLINFVISRLERCNAVVCESRELIKCVGCCGSILTRKCVGVAMDHCGRRQICGCNVSLQQGTAKDRFRTRSRMVTPSSCCNLFCYGNFARGSMINIQIALHLFRAYAWSPIYFMEFVAFARMYIHTYVLLILSGSADAYE